MSAREIDCAIGRSFDHAVGVEVDQEPIYEQEPLPVGARRKRAPVARAAQLGSAGRAGLIFPPPNTPMRRRTFSAIVLSAGVQPPSPIVETMSLRTIETVA